MPFAPALAAAYRDADYVVFGNPDLLLHVGEPNPRLDALLEDLDADGAAFLSAANPGSERRAADENLAAAAELERALANANYSRCEGEGRDPNGRWEAEPSLLAVGISRAAAEALGRRFGQNAIVFIARGLAPELVFMKKRIVLDTNVWLDWLLFDDPGMAPIRAAVAAGRAEILIDAPCAAELERVLARPFRRRTLDAAGQAAAMAQCMAVSKSIQPENSPPGLPVCRDPDDQKFLEAAACAQADFQITKDAALLELARRRAKPPFRILTPRGFADAQSQDGE
jgi:putative PIN family toxin of toxin-antitoxin system